MANIHELAENGSGREIRDLLANDKSKVNAIDGEGRTALHLAALNGNVEIARLLVGNGAEVNAQDDNKRTPIELALMNNHRAVVFYLCDRGAKLSRPTMEPQRIANAKKAVMFIDSLRMLAILLALVSVLAKDNVLASIPPVLRLWFTVPVFILSWTVAYLLMDLRDNIRCRVVANESTMKID